MVSDVGKAADFYAELPGLFVKEDEDLGFVAPVKHRPFASRPSRSEDDVHRPLRIDRAGDLALSGASVVAVDQRSRRKQGELPGTHGNLVFISI